MVGTCNLRSKLSLDDVFLGVPQKGGLFCRDRVPKMTLFEKPPKKRPKNRVRPDLGQKAKTRVLALLGLSPESRNFPPDPKTLFVRKSRKSCEGFAIKLFITKFCPQTHRRYSREHALHTPCHSFVYVQWCMTHQCSASVAPSHGLS